jgi:hypothetical protein
MREQLPVQQKELSPFSSFGDLKTHALLWMQFKNHATLAAALLGCRARISAALPSAL